MAVEEVLEKPGGVGCKDAHRLLAAFVGGGLPAKGRRALQAHVAACEECRHDYRESLAAAGRLGAQHRRLEAQEAEESREDDRARRRRLVVAAAAGSKPGRHRGSFLRLVLVPAVIVFLITNLTRIQQPPKPYDVFWKSGKVQVGDESLGRIAPEAGLIRGEWCSTDAEGEARIEGDGVELSVHPDTHVLMEDQVERRFVLRVGALTLDGPSQVVTPLGAVRVEDGAASVRYRNRRLVVESLGGEVIVKNVTGTHELGPGDPAYAVE